MDTMIQDIRYALRTLAKNRGFAAVAVITLALGVGANTAIFSVVHNVLLRPLPFAEPDRLYAVWTMLPNFGKETSSLPDYTDWREQNTVFEGLAAFTNSTANLTAGGEPERVRLLMANADLFPVLGTQPVIGRWFRPEETRPGAEKVALLSHGLWQRRFGGSPDVVGQSIIFNTTAHTIIGVAPPEMSVLSRADAISNMTLDPAAMGRRGDFLTLIGRTKPGVSQTEAQAQMDTIAQRLDQQYPQTNTGVKVGLVPLHRELAGDVRPVLLSLWAAVAFVLLIVCANVANLLLARGAAREKEIAIRAALGAGSARLVRQLLTESVVLGLAGGVMGVLLAYWSLDMLIAMAPQESLLTSRIELNAPVMLFAMAISVFTGLLFGLLPSLQTARLGLHDSLKEGGRTGLSTAGGTLRRGLVVAQISLSVMLLVGAGLMIRSVARLQEVDIGMRTENLLTFRVTLPGGRYNPQQQMAFYDRLLADLAARPGVEAATALNFLPIEGGNYLTFDLEGAPPRQPGEGIDAQVRSAYSNAIEALGIPLIRGRGLTERDREQTPRVAVVNQALVQRYFPGEDLIGRRVSFNSQNDQPVWREVVGIVGNIKQQGLEQESYPEILVPMAQQPPSAANILLRTSVPPISLVPTAREQVKNMDPALPLYDVQTMDQVVAASIANRSFQMYLLGGFAALALLLAGIGIYGVMTQTVVQRTPEFGIRMALGARPGQILGLVMGNGVTMAALGLAIGAVAALALGGALSRFLYQVSARDPFTLAGTCVVLGSVALLACYIPARRATKVDPMVALRYE